MKSFFLLTVLTTILSQASLYVHASDSNGIDLIELDIMQSLQEIEEAEAYEREQILQEGYKAEAEETEMSKMTESVSPRTIEWRTSEKVERSPVNFEVLSEKIEEQESFLKLLEAEEALMNEKYLEVQMQVSKEVEEENSRNYKTGEGKRRLRSRRR